MPERSDTEELGAELKAKVEAEARDAEADDDDDAPIEPEPGTETQDDDDDEEADDDQQQQELTEEQAAEALGMLMQLFHDGLVELFRVEQPLVEVPMEGAVGYMLPGALELKTHDKFRRCSTCNGHGQVLTGSLADQQQTANCPRCDGRGYLERLPELPDEPAPVAEQARNGDADDGYGVPKWMGDPELGRQTA